MWATKGERTELTVRVSRSRRVLDSSEAANAGCMAFRATRGAAPVFCKPHRARAARSESADEPIAAQFLAFFHAPSLPSPTFICTYPREAPRPRRQNEMFTTACRSRNNPRFDPGCTATPKRGTFTPSCARGRILVRTPWAKTLHGRPTTDRPARTCRWEGIKHGNRYI